MRNVHKNGMRRLLCAALGAALLPAAVRADTAADAAAASDPMLLVTLLGIFSVLMTAVALVLLVLLLRGRKRAADSRGVDAVTGLGNQEQFYARFHEAVTDQTREQYYVNLFAFDLEHLGESCGSKETGRILRHAAAVLQKRMQEGEFCARVGGGAFAAALRCDDAELAQKRVEEILAALNAYRGQYRPKEGELLFRAGVCVLGEEAKSADETLYDGERAYRLAAEQGEAIAFADSEVLERQRIKSSVRAQVREGLARREFMPYVQFIVSTADSSICGGELLSRWQNRMYGLMNPGEYVSIIQEMGLISELDLEMLEEACRILEGWNREGKPYFLNTNLSRITISDPELCDKILRMTEKYEFPRRRMVLEVTEDALEENKEVALQNMAALKAKGFRIALDDFSAGYSSVTNLYEYDVDIVKIDRQMFVMAEEEAQAATLLNEVARLAHKLNIEVLGEGVENAAQDTLARNAKCEYIQGYYYARPLPVRELDSFAQSYHSRRPRSDDVSWQLPVLSWEESREWPEHDRPEDMADYIADEAGIIPADIKRMITDSFNADWEQRFGVVLAVVTTQDAEIDEPEYLRAWCEKLRLRTSDGIAVVSASSKRVRLASVSEGVMQKAIADRYEELRVSMEYDISEGNYAGALIDMLFGVDPGLCHYGK